MKDDKLREEFEEYFKGVNISDEIVADAKKSVERKRNNMPKVVKYLSIAASIVLVFAVSLTIILKTDFNSTSGSGAVGDSDMSPPGSGSRPESPDYSGGDSEGDNSSGGAAQLFYYTDSELEKQTVDSSSLSSLNSSLKFIEENSSKDNCTTGYLDGELAIVFAEVELESDKASVFVEFTGEELIYNGLADYYNGDKSYYKEVPYYLTRTDNESKLLVVYCGVKYYFEIISSNENAYENYLKLIVT